MWWGAGGRRTDEEPDHAGQSLAVLIFMICVWEAVGTP